MRKITKFFDVYGMKCTSCESTVENEINKLQGVVSVDADYNNSMVIVTYDSKLCIDDSIKDAIIASGFSTTNNLLIKIIALSILVVSMFFLGNNPIVGSHNRTLIKDTSFIMLFSIGVLSSINCVSMCGGIMLTQTFNKNPHQNDKKSSLKISVLYNLGRVISYTIIGGIVGSLGSIFSASHKMQSFIQVIAAIFIILSGLNTVGIKILKNIHFPILFKKNTCVNNHKNPFIVGYLNGFMPCPSLQTIQLYVLASGSFIVGASSMFIYALGTVPLMLLFGYISSIISKNLNDRIFKFSGILIIILGIIMVQRGLAQ